MKQTSVSPLAALISTAVLAALAAAPALAQQAAPAAAHAVPPTAAPAATPVVPAATAASNASTTAASTPANDTAAASATASDTTMAPNPARAALGVAPAPYSNAATSGGLMQTTFALAFVIALLLGGAWVLKRFGPRGLGGGGNTIKLVGALNVGARERIIVVEVGEQWIVVGASPGRMNALATMARQAAPEAAPGSAPMAAPASFADWFKQTIDKRNGKQ